MPVTASAVAGVVAGGAQFFDSLGKEKKAKAELAALTPAYYKIQDEYFQNKNISQNLAQGGIPNATKDYVTNESQRGLGSSLSAILQAGGSPNDVSGLLDTYDRSIERVGAQDAEQRLQNIQYYMNANKDLAGQKNTQWTINEYQPYQNKLKELTERRAAAEQNKWGGIGTALGSVTAAGTSMSNEGLLKKLFAGPGATPATDPFDVYSNTKGIQTTPMAARGSIASATGADYLPDPGFNFPFANRPI